MSYYSAEPWQNQSRQASWEHPPSRSGASSSAGARDEGASFVSQLEEVERAIENLARSGKLMLGGPPFRRDPMMMGGPPRTHHGNDFGPPQHSGPARHHSSEFDPMRQHSHPPAPSSNVQGFYANQRYGSRKNEADSAHQAQRRMAAQRERELRNYHQEQQYNRGKPERSLSPNMSEEERRELIARQHRALYGDDGMPQGGHPAAAQDNRGPSPMAYPPFGHPQDGASKVPQPGATLNDTSNQNGPSPQPTQGKTPPVQQGSSNANQQSRTSTSSPKEAGQGSSPQRGPQHNKNTSSVAPIGTRPAAASTSQGGSAKRPTPPVTSPLGIAGTSSSERATSSASNPQGKDSNAGSGWGSGSGVWGNVGKNPLGVQASVWG